jgi:hypothetical protein
MQAGIVARDALADVEDRPRLAHFLVGVSLKFITLRRRVERRSHGPARERCILSDVSDPSPTAIFGGAMRYHPSIRSNAATLLFISGPWFDQRDGTPMFPARLLLS